MAFLPPGSGVLALCVSVVLLQGACVWQPATARAAVAMDPDYDSLPPLVPQPRPRPRPQPFVVSVHSTAPPTPLPSPAPTSAPSPVPTPAPSPATTQEVESDEETASTFMYNDVTTEEMADDVTTDASESTVPGETTTLVATTAAETTATAQDDGDWATTSAAASPADDAQVVFKLYTRAHPLEPVVLPGTSVEGTDFDVGRSTFFVIHGFTGDSSAESVTLLRDALLWAEEANVVAVDWKVLASGPHYGDAASNTRVVARALAERVAALAAGGLPLAQVHVVGFSLGAQVAGQAGHLLARHPHAAARPARITALDPARPGFHDLAEAERLDAGDADFVTVLHTASGVVSFEEPLGHVDFYPNGGRSPQPACAGQSVHVVCSHLIAPRYFAEAIYQPHNFRAVHCGSWRDFEHGLCAGGSVAFLSLNTSTSARGSYFLRTNAMEPYGRAAVDDAAGTTPAAPHYGDGDDNGNRVDAQRSARDHHSSAAPATTAATALATFATALLAAAARH